MHAVNIGPYVRERTAHQVPVFVAVAVLSIPITMVCAKSLGVLGSGIAMVSLYSIQAVLLNWVSQRLYAFRLEYRRIALVLGGFVVGYAMTAWLFGSLGPVAGAIVRPLSFLAFTGGTLLAAGFFREMGQQVSIASLVSMGRR